MKIILKEDFERLGKDRKRFMMELAGKGVGTQVHYIPVARHPFYQREFTLRPGDTPAAEEYYRKALSLQLYPRMSDEEVGRVIRRVLAASRPR